ncbi:hypothetical protein [Acidithiobacillus sp.]|uniref:hypothetical protein n=1 Tax=Acidithiobacillus sp. TaxID=1872118 RepID=UPI0025884804|nr:hypothetical protein [Acidithiobacillus sp.]MDD5375554.1 hypothetical protein [Acidithiobacillus sp.]
MGRNEAGWRFYRGHWGFYSQRLGQGQLLGWGFGYPLFALLPKCLALEPVQLVFEGVDLLFEGRQLLLEGRYLLLGMQPPLHDQEEGLRGKGGGLFEA